MNTSGYYKFSGSTSGYYEFSGSGNLEQELIIEVLGSFRALGRGLNGIVSDCAWFDISGQKLGDLTFNYSTISLESTKQEIKLVGKISSITHFNLSSNISKIIRMEGFTELSYFLIENSPISTLENIQSPIQKLLTLNLTRNDLLNINALENITKEIETLYLTNNNISDISSISSLKSSSLTHLNLSRNLISDIEPLRNLPETLKVFVISSNKIQDIEPLSNLPKSLEDIRIDYNLIEDISSFIFSPSLHTFMANNNLISNISVFAQPNFIEQLIISNNSIQDASFISTMEFLSILNVSHNNISDFSFLESLNLESLNMSNNPVSEDELINVSSYISNMSRMLRFVCQSNRLSNLNTFKSFFESIKSFNEISFQGNLLNNVDALSFVSSSVFLNSLNLGYNKIEDISSLFDILSDDTKLSVQTVVLTKNEIKNLDVNVKALTKTKNLRLNFNNIDVISFNNFLERCYDETIIGVILSAQQAIEGSVTPDQNIINKLVKDYNWIIII